MVTYPPDWLQARSADAAAYARQTYAMYEFDLLCAAWRLSQQEASGLLGESEDIVSRYRAWIEPTPDAVVDRIEMLRTVQFNLWTLRPVGDYAAWWRHRWTEASPIGARSLLEAVMADGGPAIRILNGWFDDALSGSFS